MKFNLMDKVILKNGQKGIIFELPEMIYDPSTTIRDVMYGVLYVDSKNFHYGPYYIDENDISLLVDTTIKEEKQ